MAMESTGGRESTINGAAETPSRTLKRTMRSSLIGSSMSDIFHCFCAQFSPWVYNNVIHRITGELPSKKLFGKFIPLKRLHPFGARVKVLHHLPTEQALTARTSGDSRTEETDFHANALTIVDSTQKSSFSGRFLGYANHPNVLLVLKEGVDNEPSRIM
jgi:hypothetical protein